MGSGSVFKNILAILTGFIILYFIFKWEYFLYGALVIGVLSLISERLANGINTAWMKLAMILGWINSRILLSVVFYFFLFPMAMLTRLFKRNMLNLKNTSDSLFEERNHVYTPEDLQDMW